MEEIDPPLSPEEELVKRETKILLEIIRSFRVLKREQARRILKAALSFFGG